MQAIELAIYMGFNEIYLHGMDLDEACKSTYSRFFDSNKLPVKDPNNDVANNNKSSRKQSILFSEAGLTYAEFEDINQYMQNRFEDEKKLIINGENSEVEKRHQRYLDYG